MAKIKVFCTKSLSTQLLQNCEKISVVIAYGNGCKKY